MIPEKNRLLVCSDYIIPTAKAFSWGLQLMPIPISNEVPAIFQEKAIFQAAK